MTSNKADCAKNNAPESTLSTTTAEPSCPQCGSAMVKRVARKGMNAGKSFWGRVEFPRCRGIRDWLQLLLLAKLDNSVRIYCWEITDYWYGAVTFTSDE